MIKLVFDCLHQSMRFRDRLIRVRDRENDRFGRRQRVDFERTLFPFAQELQVLEANAFVVRPVVVFDVGFRADDAADDARVPSVGSSCDNVVARHRHSHFERS